MKSMFIICSFLFVFMSCSTMKWKRKYAAKSMIRLMGSYSSNNEVIIGGTQGVFMDTASFRKISRKGLRSNIKILEKAMALAPDSIDQRGTYVDSFYSNQAKILYIKRYGLETDRKFFVDKPYKSIR